MVEDPVGTVPSSETALARVGLVLFLQGPFRPGAGSGNLATLKLLTQGKDGYGDASANKHDRGRRRQTR